MISNSIGDESLRSMDALAAGALAVLRKPGVIGSSTHEQELQALLRTLRLMADVPLVTRRAARITPSQPVTPQAPPRQAQVLAIAASTGGPAAVQVVLSSLRTDAAGDNAHFPLPILLVQHIARGFVDALVSWLDTTVPLTVKIARHQEPLLPGHVYLAPDEYHLRAGHGGVVVLQACKGEDRYCPSGDILFESVAQVYQNRAIGVILTGMGDDGAQGLRLLRAAGSPTLAQDEASCVVYGMPHAAVLAGAVAQTLPLNAIGSAILNQLHHKNQRVVQ
jgi:two-component system chemotaxis response regulator CheB